MKNRLLFAVAISLIGYIWGYPSFMSHIPNGGEVKNPCDGSSWPGVGHEKQFGGGSRNPFGIDVALNRAVWTPALCRMDSDGDGMTNGEELGDPDCLWSKGQAVNGSAIGHPGICEPVGSTNCTLSNFWFTC